MKKILFLLGAMPFFANAQLKEAAAITDNWVPSVKNQQNITLPPLMKKEAFKSKFNSKNTAKHRGVNGKRYYSFPVDMDTFLVDNAFGALFANANLDSRTVWKDSLVKVNFSNGNAAAEIMSWGQILIHMLRDGDTRYLQASYTQQVHILLIHSEWFAPISVCQLNRMLWIPCVLPL